MAPMRPGCTQTFFEMNEQLLKKDLKKTGRSRGHSAHPVVVRSMTSLLPLLSFYQIWRQVSISKIIFAHDYLFFILL